MRVTLNPRAARALCESIRTSHAPLRDAPSPLVARRSFSSSCPRLGMEEFFTSAPKEGEQPRKAGRAWVAADLRLKSFEDLHKLWFVCLKERNLLLTERLYHRQVGQAAPDGLRLGKVRSTMAQIKVVLSERARATEAMKADADRQAKVDAILNGTSRIAAAMRVKRDLSDVKVSYKKFGHKYTVSKSELPEKPTRQQRRVAFKQKKYWASLAEKRAALEAVEAAMGYKRTQPPQQQQ